MKKTYQYILKSFAGPMILAFFIVLFILIMQSLWLYIDQIVGKGLGATVILQFMFWLTLTLIPMTLPLSMLFASVMTMGNLGGNNELLALKSAGMPLTKILRPMFIIAAVITLLDVYISNNLLPYAMLKARSLLWDVKQKRPDAEITPNVFSTVGDYSIWVSKKDPKTNKMSNIMLYNHKERRGNVSVTIADSGYVKTSKDKQFTIITLYNGVAYDDDLGRLPLTAIGNPHQFQIRGFTKQQFLIDLSAHNLSRTDEDLFKGNFSVMSTQKLDHYVDSTVILQKKNINNFWKRYASQETFRGGTAEIDTVGNKKVEPVKVSNKSDDIKTVYDKMPLEKRKAVVDKVVNKINEVKNTSLIVQEDIAEQQKKIRQANVEWHNKFTLSIACFIFFLVGAPLGAIIRKGGVGTPTVVSLILFLLYFIISTMAKKMAIQGVFPVAPTIWFSDVLFIPLGVFLMYKATTDSTLFNGEMYIRFFKKLFNIEVKGSYHSPTKIHSGVYDKEIVISKLHKFGQVCNEFENALQTKNADNEKLNSFYTEYDNLLGELWGIHNEGLNEKLKDYPEISVNDLKVPIAFLRNKKIKHLVKKLELIKETNKQVEHIINRIRW